MQNLKLIPSAEMKTRLEKLAKADRRISVMVIEHIAECERRKLFLDWGFTCMYDYLTKELQYSEGSAYRRLQAARALIQMPELKIELESGAINVSQVSEAQCRIKKEEKVQRDH